METFDFTDYLLHYDGSSVDYMDYEMFLIFDETDIDRMINALLWAKNGCEGDPNCYVEE